MFTLQVHVDAAYVKFSADFDGSGLRRILAGLPGKTGPCLHVDMGMCPKEIVGKRVSGIPPTHWGCLDHKCRDYSCPQSTKI